MSSIVSIYDIGAKKRLEKIDKILLVGSGKGGVGKSFVASGLALTLCAKGYRTAILDLDIHGASLSHYLQVKPPVRSGKNGLEPKKAGKLKVMSVSLFTGENAVPMRGDKKQDFITQLFSLTNWSKLDYLVVDLPPSTGDELLSALSIFTNKSSLILVTTPAVNAVSVVSRLKRITESERVKIEGIVVNMAYVRNGKKKLELFGALNPRLLEQKLGSRLVEIAFEPRVNYESLKTILSSSNFVTRSFDILTDKITEKSNH